MSAGKRCTGAACIYDDMRSMNLLRHPWIALIVIAICWVAASAQHPNLEPDRPGHKPVPTVAFDFVLKGVNPLHYAITVDSTGRAAYRDDEPKLEDKTGEPYLLKFTIPSELASRIFDLTRQANYFQGNFDYKKGRIANMGIKTLRYADGPAVNFGEPTNGYRHQTSYNWSQNRAIQQLTEIFQDLADTIDYGRKLEFQHRYDKLALDEELKSMEEAQRSGQLLGVQAIAPVLREIASDPAVMNTARQRARKLLASEHIEPQASSSAQPSSE
ncbi:MAG: hypothetical protein ACE14M_02945 [Terriglobales bacterium]